MSQGSIELIQRAYEAVGGSDLDDAYSCLHPDIEFHTYAESPAAACIAVGTRSASTTRTCSGSSTASVTRSRRSWTPGSGSSSSAQHAVPKGGQQEIDVRMAEVWTIRDGLLAERHSYSTRAEALEAAGLTK